MLARVALPLLVAFSLAALPACRESPSKPRIVQTAPEAAVPADPAAPNATGAPAKQAPGSSGDREACVDRWLAEKGLNRYGDPPDTAYAGGNPLFNEATGETKDRLEHVFQKHPAAREACPASAAGPR